MSSIKRNVRARSLESDPEVADFVMKELVPVVDEMRSELNRVSGEAREVDENAGVLNTDRVLLCSNTSLITLDLPAATDLRGRWLTVVLLNSDVTLQAQPGEKVDGGSSLAIAKSNTDAVTLYCDGTSYHVVSSVT